MKSGEVLKILRISRPTLTKYLHQGKIKATKLDTGHYLYDDESVYSLINQGINGNQLCMQEFPHPLKKRI
jgi:predicted site-specific integrase-resolvase